MPRRKSWLAILANFLEAHCALGLFFKRKSQVHGGHGVASVSAEALEAVPPAAISLIDQIANQDHVGRPGPITSPPSKQTEQMASAASGSWHGLIA